MTVVLSRRRRLGVAVVATALLAGLLTGCDNPATAADAGGADLTQDALVSQSMTVISEAGVDESQVDLAALNRRILTGFVRHRLIAAAAAAAGVSVTEKEVDDYLDANGRPTVATALRVPQADVASATRDVLELQKIVTGLSGGWPVTDVTVTAQCADASTVNEVTRLRRLFATDPTTGPTASGAASATYDLITNVGAAPDGIFAAAIGQVVTLNPADTAGVKVCLVQGRQTKATQMKVEAINTYSSFDERLNAASLALTAQAAAEAVQINPRFGTWDAVSAQVVPNPDGT